MWKWAIAGFMMIGCNESTTEPATAGKVDTVFVRDTVLVGVGEKPADCTILERFTREGKTVVIPEKKVYPLDAAGKCPIPDPTGSSSTTCEKTEQKEYKIPASYWLGFRGAAGGVALVGVTATEYGTQAEGLQYEKCGSP